MPVSGDSKKKTIIYHVKDKMLHGINIVLQSYWIAQSVEHPALGCNILGSNLPAAPEMTLGSHSCGSLTTPRCKIGTRSWPMNSELQTTEHTGDGVSTLASKPMGGISISPKQRVPVAPQNDDIVTANI